MRDQELLDRIRRDHVAATTGALERHSNDLAHLADIVAKAFKAKARVFFCGNGGSACDAMHIAGEFVGRFVEDRAALPAIALSADSGILTAVGNDYSFEDVYARQIEALGHGNDILIALSTSGKSPNILKALAAAQKQGLKTVLFTGEKGKNSNAAEQVFIVPSTITAHIQEAHMVMLHALASLVESRI
ncbi:MAG: SIS domain-containing protein [Alphaproteobacteria bacterium]